MRGTRYYYVIYSFVNPSDISNSFIGYTGDPFVFGTFLRQLSFQTFDDKIIGEEVCEDVNHLKRKLKRKYPKLQFDPDGDRLALIDPRPDNMGVYAIRQQELDDFDFDLATRLMCNDTSRAVFWIRDMLRKYRILNISGIQLDTLKQFLQLVLFYSNTITALLDIGTATIEDIPWFDQLAQLTRGDSKVSSQIEMIANKDLFDVMDLDRLWYLQEIEHIHRGRILR